MNIMKSLNTVHLGKECMKYFNVCWRSMSVQSQPHQLSKEKPKTGILMVNMGGPSTIEEVPDYLLRIMTDTDIIKLPVQSKLGPFIAKMRTSSVQKKYSEIGGGSPILKWTNIQGELLCEQLDKVSPESAPHKHYVAFRYANPFTEDALQKLEEDGVEHTVIFSQYPQYSCVTTGSSLNAIYRYYKNRSFPNNMKLSVIDRWSVHPLFIKTIAARIIDELSHIPVQERGSTMILFSAHSIPLQAVTKGDPYPYEVGATVQLVMKELNHCCAYNLVWQSKVGPVSWLSPFTDEAITALSKRGIKNFILVPVAFVNEHIETLHELDIEYREELMEKLNVKSIRRAKAPNDHPIFIEALTDIVSSHLRLKQWSTLDLFSPCTHCTSKICIDSKDWYSRHCDK